MFVLRRGMKCAGKNKHNLYDLFYLYYYRRLMCLKSQYRNKHTPAVTNILTTFRRRCRFCYAIWIIYLNNFKFINFLITTSRSSHSECPRGVMMVDVVQGIYEKATIKITESHDSRYNISCLVENRYQFKSTWYLQSSCDSVIAQQGR